MDSNISEGGSGGDGEGVEDGVLRAEESLEKLAMRQVAQWRRL